MNRSQPQQEHSGSSPAFGPAQLPPASTALAPAALAPATFAPDSPGSTLNSRPSAFDSEILNPEIFDPDLFDPETLAPQPLNPDKWMLGAMLGRSLTMQSLFTRMRCTAPHFRLVSVEGEPGTGKLLAAQTLHHIGASASGPFIPALASDFLRDPQAFWKEAHGGLAYLSRIDELTADQQRLLRDILERLAHQRLRNLATPGPRQIVVGSSQSLRRLASTAAFRSDLVSHLTAIRFFLPPLRDRREDLPLLAGLFLRHWIRRHSKPLRGFAPGALSRLAIYSWPGNLRELDAVLSAAALDCPGQWIRPIDIPRLQWPAAFPPDARFHESPDFPLDDPNLDRAILRHITRVLALVNGNKVRAAHMLGISRSTLYRLLESAPPPSAPPAQDLSAPRLS